jgi:transcriptional regulator with XRE-family HTH domain
MFTPQQSRAARGWLNWTVQDLAEKSMHNRKTVADFENGGRLPHERTLRDMRRAFEDAGIAFTYDGSAPNGFRAKIVQTFVGYQP